MLGSEAALKIVMDALDALNQELPDDRKIPLTATTPLFGAGAIVDSLSLVSIIVDVELAVSEALGRSISLTDDRALSQAVSPFTDPRALVDYILTLTAEDAKPSK